VKVDELLESRTQNQHLQATLKELEVVWQRKLKTVETERDELM
jgi:hypothetical protein